MHSVLCQKLDLSRDDIVHRADDRDPPFPDEAVERLALFAHLFNNPQHVAAGHGIDERLLLGRRYFLGTPAGDRVGRLLDVVDDVVEVLAAGGFGGRPDIADEVDGRGHGAASGVSHDQNQLRSGHGTAILHAGQHLPARDVAGDADAEDVAHAQVEDQLGGCAGIDATEHDGQGVLPVGRGADLAAEVAGQTPAGAEPFVAVLQDLQHLLRGE